MARERIPNEIIAIDNPDKEFHERWYRGRNLLNFPHPFRAVMLGPPNVGKSTVCKNIILRAMPEFEEVFVVHCDPTYTKEYDDLGESCTILEHIPEEKEFEGRVKTLVILDDLDFKYLDTDQRRNLGRLYGYASTHKNISCCLCSQDPINVPTMIRRCANLWVLWKMTDLDALSNCARKTGMKSLAFRSIFNNLMHEPHDSLWIDLTDHTPQRLRKNGFIPIEIRNSHNGTGRLRSGTRPKIIKGEI